MQRVETVLISILSLLNDAEVSSPANANTRVAKTLRSMRSISINNDLLRHEQQQQLPILQQILNCYIFIIMTLLRQTQERSSRDSIYNAITLTSNKYETLYAEVKREIRERAILYYTAPNSRLCTITHLAMRSKQRKMRCNYNPETRLRNNNRYAKAIVYNARQSNTTLKREIEFENKRSSIYYYTKTADNTVATKLYRATFIIKLLI
ncbi:hypothetical protein HBI29_241790 [Parastagonospora nodorum]|nr:hypothetical protein HBI29_241790 [Parastagonospora nodorum]